MEDRLELPALQGAEDGLPCDLLPPGSSLFIAHDEVLIIDACKVKVQHPSVYSCFPHQTGVTERSISGHQRCAAHRILDHVVIGHQAYRISHRLSMVLDRQHHVGIIHEGSIT